MLLPAAAGLIWFTLLTCGSLYILIYYCYYNKHFQLYYIRAIENRRRCSSLRQYQQSISGSCVQGKGKVRPRASTIAGLLLFGKGCHLTCGILRVYSISWLCMFEPCLKNMSVSPQKIFRNQKPGLMYNLYVRKLFEEENIHGNTVLWKSKP